MYLWIVFNFIFVGFLILNLFLSREIKLQGRSSSRGLLIFFQITRVVWVLSLLSMIISIVRTS